jgi:hypothetical protein
MMIVVTSTAKDATGYAGRCAASVAAQGTPEVSAPPHYFGASDQPTADAAREGGAGRGTLLNVMVDPRPSLEKLWDIWQDLHPASVIVWLDGDDELTPGALHRVRRYYGQPGVWLTYGSFVRDDGRLDYYWNPAFGRRYEHAPRKERWRASHLRTFRAGLVQQVPREYLIDPATGTFFQNATDVALMVPLLELAGPRYLAVTDVNCVYHYAHSAEANQPNTTRANERRILDHLAGLAPLEPLAERPWSH